MLPQSLQYKLCYNKLFNSLDSCISEFSRSFTLQDWNENQTSLIWVKWNQERASKQASKQEHRTGNSLCQPYLAELQKCLIEKRLLVLGHYTSDSSSALDSFVSGGGDDSNFFLPQTHTHTKNGNAWWCHLSPKTNESSFEEEEFP